MRAAPEVRRFAWIMWLLLAGCGLLLSIALIRHLRAAPPGAQGDADSSLSVPAVAARIQPMPVVLQAVGQVVSAHTVQIRPQVTGMLKQIFFVEGRTVSQGQRLYLIEPAPFEAALASARAAWQNAKGNADRMERLVGQGYVIAQDYRNARAVADQAGAAFRQAQINLSYTDIRAPITGRTGSATVKSGNIVSPSDPIPLVVINEMAPIQVQFSIPQQFLTRVRAYQAHNDMRVRISADASSRDPPPYQRATEVVGEGALVFVDNTINPNTGTVLLKAQLANEREQFWPGQFVNVTLQLTIEARAVVVPQTAVQTGQTGSYVYVIREGRAEVAPVHVDRQVGELSVISTGLNGDEQVVARAPRNLRPGMHVLQRPDAALPPAPVTLSNSR